MNRTAKLGITFGVLSLLLLAVVIASRSSAPAVVPNANYIPVEGGLTTEDRVELSTRNLSFEKEGRSIAAARDLARLGAAAKSAVPTLEKFIANKASDVGPLSDKQLQVFKETLEKIRSELPAGETVSPKPENGSA